MIYFFLPAMGNPVHKPLGRPTTNCQRDCKTPSVVLRNFGPIEMRFLWLFLLVALDYEPVKADRGPNQLDTMSDHYQSYAPLVPTAFSVRVSNVCRQDSLTYFESLDSLTPWAWKMLSSSGSLTAIYSTTDPSQMGHFDKCLSISTTKFAGQHCTADIHFQGSFERFNHVQFISIYGRGNSRNQSAGVIFNSNPTDGNNTSIQIGMCIPSSCRATDLQRALEDVFSSYYETAANVSTHDDFCATRIDQSTLHFDAADITVLIALLVLSALSLIGTCVDVTTSLWHQNETASVNRTWIKIVRCFSLRRNIGQLTSAKHSGQHVRSLSCLHGIRFLTMTWVVLGHSWIQGILQPHRNVEALAQDGLKWSFQVIANGTVSVDGFFLLSGLLVSYLLLQQLDRNEGKLNLGAFYLHRYIRLTVVHVAILSFVATLLVHLGSGPHWHTIRSMAKNCRKVWHQQLLYINNFTPAGANEQCMTETWYLANDVQLFLISPLLIYPLWRWKAKGLLPLALLTAASLAGNVVMFYVYQLPPTSMITRPKTMSKALVEFWVYYYPQPWFRAPPYLVGILTGWILYKTRDQIICLSKRLVFCAWVSSALTGLVVIYGLSPFVDEESVPKLHPALSLIYGPFHRFAWSLTLAWVIFACTKGYGGWVNQFLSWSVFVPFSRISYATYLIHYTVINSYYALIRQPVYYTTYGQFYLWIGHLTTSLLLATIISLTIGIPFVNLERMACCNGDINEPVEETSTSTENAAVHKMTYGKTNKGFTIA